MDETALKEYKASLADLKFNSKPLINALTMLAEDHIANAPEIVQLVETQLQKAPSNEKLPIMYLMDSIVKNVKGPYQQLFAKNLVHKFCGVFVKVNEKTRASLFKLRSTWNQYFAGGILHALDVRVKKIDPAWPIMAASTPATPAIHINPKFIKKPAPMETTSAPPPAPDQPSVSTVVSDGLSEKERREQEMRQSLLAKQQELLQIQQQRLELELEQTRARLAAQAKELEAKDEVIAQQKLQFNQKATQSQAATPLTATSTVGMPQQIAAVTVPPNPAALLGVPSVAVSAPAPAPAPAPASTGKAGLLGDAPAPRSQVTQGTLGTQGILGAAPRGKPPAKTSVPGMPVPPALAVNPNAMPLPLAPAVTADGGTTNPGILPGPGLGVGGGNPAALSRDPRRAAAASRDPRLARDPRLRQTIEQQHQQQQKQQEQLLILQQKKQMLAQQQLEQQTQQQPQQHQMYPNILNQPFPGTNTQGTGQGPGIGPPPRVPSSGTVTTVAGIQQALSSAVPVTTAPGPVPQISKPSALKFKEQSKVPVSKAEESKVKKEKAPKLSKSTVKLDHLDLSGKSKSRDESPAEKAAKQGETKKGKSERSETKRGQKTSSRNYRKPQEERDIKSRSEKRTSQRSVSSESPSNRDSHSRSRSRSRSPRPGSSSPRSNEKRERRGSKSDGRSKESKENKPDTKSEKRKSPSPVREEGEKASSKKYSKQDQLPPKKRARMIEKEQKEAEKERENRAYKSRSERERAAGWVRGSSTRDHDSHHPAERPLHRRPSLVDPNIKIPQELSLSKLAKVLEQADKQLHSGAITHDQHQQLLKELNALYNLQRLKKEEEKHSRQEPPHGRRDWPPQDPRGPNPMREPFNPRDPRDPRSFHDRRDPRDPRGPRDPRSLRDPGHPHEMRDPHDPRGYHGPREMHAYQGPRDPRGPVQRRDVLEQDEHPEGNEQHPKQRTLLEDPRMRRFPSQNNAGDNRKEGVRILQDPRLKTDPILEGEPGGKNDTKAPTHLGLDVDERSRGEFRPHPGPLNEKSPFPPMDTDERDLQQFAKQGDLDLRKIPQDASVDSKMDMDYRILPAAFQSDGKERVHGASDTDERQHVQPAKDVEMNLKDTTGEEKPQIGRDLSNLGEKATEKVLPADRVLEQNKEIKSDNEGREETTIKKQDNKSGTQAEQDIDMRLKHDIKKEITGPVVAEQPTVTDESIPKAEEKLETDVPSSDVKKEVVDNENVQMTEVKLPPNPKEIKMDTDDRTLPSLPKRIESQNEEVQLPAGDVDFRHPMPGMHRSKRDEMHRFGLMDKEQFNPDAPPLMNFNESEEPPNMDFPEREDRYWSEEQGPYNGPQPHSLPPHGGRSNKWRTWKKEHPDEVCAPQVDDDTHMLDPRDPRHPRNRRRSNEFRMHMEGDGPRREHHDRGFRDMPSFLPDFRDEGMPPDDVHFHRRGEHFRGDPRHYRGDFHPMHHEDFRDVEGPPVLEREEFRGGEMPMNPENLPPEGEPRFQEGIVRNGPIRLRRHPDSFNEMPPDLGPPDTPQSPDMHDQYDEMSMQRDEPTFVNRNRPVDDMPVMPPDHGRRGPHGIRGPHPPMHHLERPPFQPREGPPFRGPRPEGMPGPRPEGMPGPRPEGIPGPGPDGMHPRGPEEMGPRGPVMPIPRGSEGPRFFVGPRGPERMQGPGGPRPFAPRGTPLSEGPRGPLGIDGPRGPPGQEGLRGPPSMEGPSGVRMPRPNGPDGQIHGPTGPRSQSPPVSMALPRNGPAGNLPSQILSNFGSLQQILQNASKAVISQFQQQFSQQNQVPAQNLIRSALQNMGMQGNVPNNIMQAAQQNLLQKINSMPNMNMLRMIRPWRPQGPMPQQQFDPRGGPPGIPQRPPFQQGEVPQEGMGPPPPEMQGPPGQGRPIPQGMPQPEGMSGPMGMVQGGPPPAMHQGGPGMPPAGLQEMPIRPGMQQQLGPQGMPLGGPHPGFQQPQEGPMQPFPAPQPQPAAPAPASQFDINSLFSKLISSGIIKKPDSPHPEQTSTPPPSTSTSTAAPSTEEKENEKTDKETEFQEPEEDEVFDYPEMSLVTDELKARHPGLIKRMYSGMQCTSCGQRFVMAQMDRYRKHLDWHFRQNRKKQDGIKAITSRKWYYEVDEWLEYEEINDTEDARSTFFDEQAQEYAQRGQGMQSVPVTSNANDEVCKICREKFEQFFDEETEEWHLRDAIRVDGRTFHPSCYEDVKDTSGFLETPTDDLQSPPFVRTRNISFSGTPTSPGASFRSSKPLFGNTGKATWGEVKGTVEKPAPSEGASSETGKNVIKTEPDAGPSTEGAGDGSKTLGAIRIKSEPVEPMEVAPSAEMASTSGDPRVKVEPSEETIDDAKIKIEPSATMIKQEMVETEAAVKKDHVKLEDVRSTEEARMKSSPLPFLEEVPQQEEEHMDTSSQKVTDKSDLPTIVPLGSEIQTARSESESQEMATSGQVEKTTEPPIAKEVDTSIPASAELSPVFSSDAPGAVSETVLETQVPAVITTVKERMPTHELGLPPLKEAVDSLRGSGQPAEPPVLEAIAPSRQTQAKPVVDSPSRSIFDMLTPPPVLTVIQTEEEPTPNTGSVQSSVDGTSSSN